MCARPGRFRQITENWRVRTLSSQTLKEIVDTLSGGKVASKLVTILPGRRIDQIRADLINDGYSPSEVDAALQPANYKICRL